MSSLWNNERLQDFILNDVIPTGKILGTGSYGLVLEVKYHQLVCAAKKLHDVFLEDGNEGVVDVARKYQQECHLMASLRHPNIAQFLGICFVPGVEMPLLVMERLEMSLCDLLDSVPNLPLPLKVSFLEDVGCGLVYLHNMHPPVIHRDLTANNVLLTSSLVAKITDMGNSRIIKTRPDRLARTLSQLPGTLVYMAPEAMSETHRYGTSLDIFSFGHLALFTMTQVFPCNLMSSTYYDPNNPDNILARSEVQRRELYLERLEAQVGQPHPLLVQLIRQCLHNALEKRPSSEDLLCRVQKVREEVEGMFGGNVRRHLDIGKVLLTKELKMVEELCQRAERRASELETRCLAAEKRTKEQERQMEEAMIAERKARKQIEEMELRCRAVEEKTREKDRQMEEMAARCLASKATTGELEISVEKLEIENERDRALKDRLLDDLWVEVSGLTEKIPSGTEKLVLRKQVGHAQFHLDIKWTCGPDAPFGMTRDIQSVVVQGTLYFGGGSAGQGGDNYMVMTYDIHSHKCHQLPPYMDRDFAMTVVRNQLVLVGGRDRRGAVTDHLGVWKADGMRWTHSYPSMPTARYNSSAVTYKKWLVVAGGISDFGNLSVVEVLDLDSERWCKATSTPSPWSSMRSSTIGDMWYLMGGRSFEGADKIYSVSLPALISRSNTTSSSKSPNQMMPGLGCSYSTPLCTGGSLFVVGGWNIKDCIAVSTIHRYLPRIKKWISVGDLPSARYNCTCVVTPSGEVLVAGGYGNNSSKVLLGEFL